MRAGQPSLASTQHLDAPGLDERVLTAAVRSGILLRPRRGAYIRRTDWEGTEPWTRDALRIQVHLLSSRGSSGTAMSALPGKSAGIDSMRRLLDEGPVNERVGAVVSIALSADGGRARPEDFESLGFTVPLRMTADGRKPRRPVAAGRLLGGQPVLAARPCLLWTFGQGEGFFAQHILGPENLHAQNAPFGIKISNDLAFPPGYLYRMHLRRRFAIADFIDELDVCGVGFFVIGNFQRLPLCHHDEFPRCCLPIKDGISVAHLDASSLLTSCPNPVRNKNEKDLAALGKHTHFFLFFFGLS